MKTALVVIQLVLGALSLWPHRKPAPRPVVTAVDTPSGGVLIHVTCPAPYVVVYPAGAAVPTTVGERMNLASAATCGKKKP